MEQMTVNGRIWAYARRLMPVALGAAAFAAVLLAGPTLHDRKGDRSLLSVAPAVAQTGGVRRRVIIRRQPTRLNPNRLRKAKPQTPPKPPADKVASPKAAPPPPPPPSSVPQPPDSTVPPKVAAGDSVLLPPDVRERLRNAPTTDFAADNAIAGETRPQQVIITFNGRVNQAVLDTVGQQYGLAYVDGLFVSMLNADIHRFTFGTERTFDDVANVLRADARIAAAQRAFVFRVQGKTEPETKIQKQAVLQYALAKLHVPEARERATGEAVKVAVIDSMVDTAHPEFEGARLTVFDAVPGNGSGPDAHGTAVTGIIAAQKTLGAVAPGVQVLAARSFVPVKDSALDAGDTMSLLRGFDWAERQGARIFNMSFAGPKDPLLIQVLDAAHAKGIIMVAAAGNAGPAAPPLYPAAHGHVIAVTATDWTDALYAKANRGRQIAVAAPGVDILSVAPGGDYAMMSGTSFATAHVSAVIALLLEAHPGLTPDAVLKLVTASARDLGPKGPDTAFGAGLADALHALEASDKVGRMAQ